jgi:hypothetical protein
MMIYRNNVVDFEICFSWKAKFMTFLIKFKLFSKFGKKSGFSLILREQDYEVKFWNRFMARELFRKLE